MCSVQIQQSHLALGKATCSWQNRVSFDSEDIYNIFVTELTQIGKDAFVALKGTYVFEADTEVIVNVTIPAALPSGTTVYLFGVIEGTPRQIEVFLDCAEKQEVRVLSDLNRMA